MHGRSFSYMGPTRYFWGWSNKQAIMNVVLYLKLEHEQVHISNNEKIFPKKNDSFKTSESLLSFTQ